MRKALLIPRHSVIWLLVALLLAMGPHLIRQPAWLLAGLGASMGWRYQIWSGRWPLPDWPIKTSLVLMSLIGIWLAYGSLIGIDPAMALLIAGSALKGIEFSSYRDYLVLVFLAYFIAACNFIYEQAISTAVYVLLALTAVTAALIAGHQGDQRRGYVSPMRLAGKMLLQAIPLMILLFVVFPRISPLWSIPQPGNHARSGPASDMSPGDISQLSRSTGLAFRVTFDDQIPAQRELYWRGLVLTEFDGRRWRMNRRNSSPFYSAGQVSLEDQDLQTSGQDLGYEVILEPTWRNWAFALDLPLDVDSELRFTSDISLVTNTTLTQRVSYRARSDPQARFGLAMKPDYREANLVLPDGFNPRSVDLARQWRNEASSDGQFIERVTTWFNQEEFVYTLSPPLLGRDSVDEFLFGERRGFCEHYASSFVFLMRAAGIPARVVVGYQGGERHPIENYLLVYQYDAHAWAEVWLEGRGWVRFDPTAAVAPERIESSFQNVFGAAWLAETPLSLALLRNFDVFNWMRMNWDMVGYHWARMVLAYDRERQYDLLTRILGKITAQRMVMFLLGSGALILLLVGFSLLRGRTHHRLDPITRRYLGFCRHLARQGLPRQTGEGPQSYAKRVAQSRPELAEPVQSITESYVGLTYGDSTEFDAFRRLLRYCQLPGHFQ